jgi:putative MATE family efflux protein
MSESTKREIPGIFDGPILKVLTRITLPIFCGMVFQIIYAIVNIIWVSRIDLEDPAYVGGVGLIFPILVFAIAISSGVLIGVGSLVARSIGENNHQALSRVAESGFFITGLLSAAVITLGYVFDEQLVNMLGAKGEYYVHAIDFFRSIIPVAGLMFMGNVLLGILLGEGRTPVVMLAMIITTVANVILDPVFIFILKLGVKGAGLAIVVSQVITAAYLLPVFLRNKSSVGIEWRLANIDFGVMKKIIAVGFPHAAGQIVMAVSVLVLNRITLGIDKFALTAYSVCARFDQMLVVPVMAVGSGLITMMGQNFGRGKFSRVKAIWRTGSLAGVAVSALPAVLLFVFAPRIVPFFTTVEEVARFGVRQMRTVELSFVLGAVAIVGTSSFQAIARPLPGLAVTTVRLAAVTIPLAYLLVRILDLGMYGVWFGVIAGNIVSAIVGFLWVRSDLTRLQRGDGP